MCGRPLPWGRSKASKSWPRPAAAWTRSSTSCATLSLSPRVNDILMNLRVGQPLDFEFEFGQEMPQNADLRKRLFLELAQEGAVIENGVVDVERGVIYKAASSRSQQRRSALVLAAALIAGGLVLPAALAWI